MSYDTEILKSELSNMQEHKPKCYISGKITGIYESVAKANFGFAQKNLEMDGLFEAVNPMELDHDHEYADTLTKDDQWAYYMDNCIKALLICDAIYMLSNWGQSKGARVERAIAIELGLEIIYQ